MRRITEFITDVLWVRGIRRQYGMRGGWRVPIKLAFSYARGRKLVGR